MIKSNVRLGVHVIVACTFVVWKARIISCFACCLYHVKSCLSLSTFQNLNIRYTKKQRRLK